MQQENARVLNERRIELQSGCRLKMDGACVRSKRKYGGRGRRRADPGGWIKLKRQARGATGAHDGFWGGGQGLRNLSRTGTSPVSSTSQRLFGAGSGGTIFSTIQRCGCSWVLLKPCQCLDLLSVLRFCRLQHRSSEHRHVVVVCLPGASSLPTSAVHNHWAHGPISPAAHTRPHHSGASHPGGLA